MTVAIRKDAAKRERAASKGRGPRIAGDLTKAPDLVGPTEAAFPIVVIGASAGGLAGFEAFFSGIPKGEDPGMAFALVQHLAPDHKSIPAERGSLEIGPLPSAVFSVTFTPAKAHPTDPTLRRLRGDAPA